MERLGPYKLERKLGEGGMGAVYFALDEVGLPVALKVVRRELLGDEEYRGRFLREVKIALALNHEHIVKAHEAGEHEGQLYLASEFVEGGSLADLLKREGRLTAERSLELIQELLEALQHAHEHGLIHRDVKPENVLLTRDGHVKLADVGLARGVEAEATRFTKSGEAIGTPTYLAPEQARGDLDLDIRCDLYAVGVTLFELLTGTAPFTGKTYLDVLRAHLYEPAPDPQDRQSGLPLGLRRLVQDLMEKRPADRPKDPEEALLRVAILRGTAALPGPPPRPAGATSTGRVRLATDSGALAAPASAAPATATPWDATLPQSGNRPSPLAGLAEATLAHGATTQPTDDAVIEVAPERPSGSQLELAAQLTVPSGGDPAPTTSVHYRSAVPLGDPLMSARLTRKDGDGETTLFAVGGQSLQLGRNGIDRSSNDLTVRVLPGQSHRDRNMRISGNHLRINSTPEGLFAVDLQSANGSSVDGAALGPSAPHPLTRRHDIGLADALKLCARVTLSPAQALTVDDDEVPRRSSVRIDRVDNRPDLVYALVASALPWHELQLIYAGTSLFVIGSPHTSIHVQGVALAADQALTLCDGLTFHAGAAEYTVHKIEAEDMK